MEQKKLFLDAIHSLTLVLRAVLFRPSSTKTTDMLETQIVFKTNEMIHVIASHRPNSFEIECEYESWRNEILKISNHLTPGIQSAVLAAIKSAENAIGRLIESFVTSAPSELGRADR